MAAVTPAWAELRRKAAAQIETNKAILLKCFSHGIIYPTTWKAYDAALQAIVDGVPGEATTLPAQPAMPDFEGGSAVLGQQGAKGDKGDKGDPGEQGPAGPKGDKGDTAPSVWGGGV